MNARSSPFSGRVFPDPFPPLCASAWGDDRFGLWCEIDVGGVVQRLRWIEPGEFWKGSDESERLRHVPSDFGVWELWWMSEGPPSVARIEEGFWLADTACTRELWAAVMGPESPRWVNAEPGLPRDQLNWAQLTGGGGFLDRLSATLTGCNATLPTDVEWEYACRAGTNTAFFFGDSPSISQINAGQGARLLPVKALPCNSWGLYQMHGNVWEWCAHGNSLAIGSMSAGDDSLEKRDFRLLRGGAWNFELGWARSAARYPGPPDDGAVGFGFRFALRSIEPSAGGGTQAGAEAGGAR